LRTSKSNRRPSASADWHGIAYAYDHNIMELSPTQFDM